MNVIMFHNPRCSKSRETLALLNDRGAQVEIVEYLNTPPDTNTLRALVDKLGVTARDIVRTGESAYRELGLADPGISDDAVLEAIASHPILLQRPIVVRDGKAALGRPPENVLALLD
ncbi:MAG: arsenate reductase (glutaredoxin) [Proteobacteria bacterium]|nr:MAG: arsenate reductase (glutaredoxin) [Pseudomonadota bacterium]